MLIRRESLSKSPLKHSTTVQFKEIFLANVRIRNDSMYCPSVKFVREEAAILLKFSVTFRDEVELYSILRGTLCPEKVTCHFNFTVSLFDKMEQMYKSWSPGHSMSSLDEIRSKGMIDTDAAMCEEHSFN